MTVEKAKDIAETEGVESEDKSIEEMVILYNENLMYDADTGDILEPVMTVDEMRGIMGMPSTPVDQMDIPKEEGVRYLVQETGCSRKLAEEAWNYSLEFYSVVHDLDWLMVMMDEYQEAEAYSVSV